MSQRPLRLKSEKVSSKPRVTPHTQFFEVCVDTGVTHLDSPYTYAYNADESSIQITCGTYVEVPFNNRMVRGYVLRPAPEIVNPKFIRRILSKQSLFTAGQLSLFEKVASRYASSLWDVIRLAVPPVSNAAFFEFKHSNAAAKKLAHNVRAFSLKIGVDRHKAIYEIALQSKKNKILIIVPNQRDVGPLVNLGAIPVDGGLGKSQTFQSYLKANNDLGIFVGLRSAIFLDMPENSLLLILDDSDPSHHEIRQPTFNTRDVALMRTHEINVGFVSVFHSPEVARLIDSGWIREVAVKGIEKYSVEADPDARSFQRDLKSFSSRGIAVAPLFSKSYRTSIACQKCRSRALCQCGGPVVEIKKGTLSCSVCEKIILDWRCSFCGDREIRTLTKGGSLLAEELARSISNTKIIKITKDIAERVEIPDQCIILSTLGMEPNRNYEYVAITDAERMLSFSHLRSDEIAMLRWLNLLSHLKAGGKIAISLPPDSLVARSIFKNDWWIFMRSILVNRAEVGMPPTYRVIVVRGASKDLQTLQQAIPEKNIVSVNPERIVIRTSLEERDEMAHICHQTSRLISMKRGRSLRIEVDPYIFV